jgi:hypothetical protein
MQHHVRASCHYAPRVAAAVVPVVGVVIIVQQPERCIMPLCTASMPAADQPGDAYACSRRQHNGAPANLATYTRRDYYKDTAHRRIGRPRHSPIDACWYGVYGVHGMYGVCVATGDSTRMVSMHHAALSMHHVARHTPHLATPLPTYVHVATAAQNKRAMDE